MAVAAVFSTAELFEAIICHLVPHDLLFARTVCKGWRTTIDGSAGLQTALFMRPEPTTTAWILDPSVCIAKDKFTPLGRIPIKGAVPADSTLLRDHTLPRVVPVAFNPLLLTQKPTPYDSLGYRAANGERPYLNVPTAQIRVDHYQTCEDMFLTQPPCQVVEVITKRCVKPAMFVGPLLEEDIVEEDDEEEQDDEDSAEDDEWEDEVEEDEWEDEEDANSGIDDFADSDADTTAPSDLNGRGEDGDGDVYPPPSRWTRRDQIFDEQGVRLGRVIELVRKFGDEVDLASLKLRLLRVVEASDADYEKVGRWTVRWKDERLKREREIADQRTQLAEQQRALRPNLRQWRTARLCDSDTDDDTDDN